MTRTQTLDAAKAAVTGERERSYGHPEDSFERIADYWSAYLTHILPPPQFIQLSALDVANMMILMKLAREENKHSPDNYVDIAGYAACAEECANDEV